MIISRFGAVLMLFVLASLLKPSSVVGDGATLGVDRDELPEVPAW